MEAASGKLSSAPTRTRQSRWARGEGKSAQITERDLRYLEVLYDNGPTRANLLHAMVCPGVTQKVTTVRLRKLHRLPNAYVDRPARQRESYNANYSFLVYEISKKGEQLLAERGRVTEENRVWRANTNRGRYLAFWHEVLIADVMGSIRLGIAKDPCLRLVTWAEILQRAPAATRALKFPLSMHFRMASTINGTQIETKVTPDALFGLEYTTEGKKSYRFFALEADRATEPIRRASFKGSSYHKKIEQYRELVKQEVYRTQLGIPNLFVLTVTTGENHMRNIMSFLEELVGRSSLFLFKSVRESFEEATEPSPNILEVPWARVGHELFRIDEP